MMLAMVGKLPSYTCICEKCGDACDPKLDYKLRYCDSCYGKIDYIENLRKIMDRGLNVSSEKSE
jgi:hypothetical protein